MKFLWMLLLCSAALPLCAQESVRPFPHLRSVRAADLPFSFRTSERTEGLPPYVTPPQPNLYNSTPDFKVGWGIDYPIGHVTIDNEVWVIFNRGNQYGTHVKVARFKGRDFEHTVQQEDGSIDITDKNVSTHFLGGLWYDADAGMLYAPIHCEYKRDISPPAGWTRKKTRLASSSDKGLTWKLEGDILTDCLPAEDDWLKFSGSYFEAGPADLDLYVDAAGGYFYLFSSNAYVPKSGKMNNFLWFNEVARCPIGARMAPGSWRKFCNGTWAEPGLGGRSSKVSMDSYGIYGRIIYSTFLKTYLRIGPCLGVGDKRYTDLGFTDGSIYLSTCDDLSTQAWSPKVKLFDAPANSKLGITVTDGARRDAFLCDSSLHIYNYWLYDLPSRAIDVTFMHGSTPIAEFPPYGSYAYEPLPESGDSIVARRTRIAGCSDAGMSYTGGAWAAKNGPHYYRTEIRESGIPGTAVTFSFTGADIYWRAVADTDGGRADVFIDDALAGTVECYYPRSLPFQFAFIKTGLDANRTHTIRVTVRDDHDPRSHGTMVRHMAFEHAAESYRASAGFSSVWGKNHWRYEYGDGKKFAPMEFHYADTTRTGEGKAMREKITYPNYWGRTETAVVGPDHQRSGRMDAVRTFIAPHAGRIRIEGRACIESPVRIEGSARIDTGRVNAEAAITIMKNSNAALLDAQVSVAAPVDHDRIIRVRKGDAVRFIVRSRRAGRGGGGVQWDPAITFLR